MSEYIKGGLGYEMLYDFKLWCQNIYIILAFYDCNFKSGKEIFWADQTNVCFIE